MWIFLVYVIHVNHTRPYLPWSFFIVIHNFRMIKWFQNKIPTELTPLFTNTSLVTFSLPIIIYYIIMYLFMYIIDLCFLRRTGIRESKVIILVTPKTQQDSTLECPHPQYRAEVLSVPSMAAFTRKLLLYTFECDFINWTRIHRTRKIINSQFWKRRRFCFSPLTLEKFAIVKT